MNGATVNGATAYIGLGSNLGDKITNCERALQEIAEEESCSLRNRSSWYQTQPWGMENQGWFVNGVAEIKTSLGPHELLERFQNIEKRFGREVSGHWGPRIIDIDILFYASLMLRTPELEIPHPRLHERNFVLVPLMEIAPEVVHPVLKKTVRQLFSVGEDHKEVQKILEE